MAFSDYKKLTNHAGIYKHKDQEKYLVRKKVDGKVYSKTFKRLNEARRWHHTFNGERPSSPLNKTTPTLQQVWIRMGDLHFQSLAPSTINIWRRRFKNLSFLYEFHMEDLKPHVINDFLEQLIAKYEGESHELGRGNGCRKYNLDNELNMLVTICNWYKAEQEFNHHTFVHPVLPRHRKISKFRELPKKNKKISPDEAFQILQYLPELYRDLFTMQYLVAGRIGEIAGIQIKNIDLENRVLTIKETCYWSDVNKTFISLNPLPKNREARSCYISDIMLGIIKKRLRLKVKDCNFLFHVNGKPLNYCTIQSQIRNAQRKAGSNFTGTHIFRHGMATLVRKLTNNLDAVQAITGHKDRDLADHYSQIDDCVQKDTTLLVENYIKDYFNPDKNVLPFHKLGS